jgi:hypothetical protein
MTTEILVSESFEKCRAEIVASRWRSKSPSAAISVVARRSFSPSLS